MYTIRLQSLAIIIAGSLIVAGGCRSQSLSREEAAEVIAKSEQFKAPSTREILLGPDPRGPLGMLSQREISARDAKFDLDFADCLVGTGYLTLDDAGFALTKKGQEADQGWGRDLDRVEGRVIPVAEPEFVEITGISQPEGGIEAEVEFAWRWKWTPIMNGMDCTDCGADCQIGMAKQYGYHYYGESRFDVRKKRVHFRRYDDGWRIEDLSLEE